jgi:hypothetical protein
MTVLDQYLEKVASDKKDLVYSLDSLIIQAAPELQTSLKWGNLTYHHAQNICSLVTHKNHINLQFWNAIGLDDPEHLLQGTGRTMRHIKIEKESDINHLYIARLIKQATACS